MALTLKQMMGMFLDSLKAEIEAAGMADTLCAIALYPGDAVPLDYGQESCGGMAWVRLASAVPSASFPAAVTAANNCAYTLAFEGELGLFRPAPIADEEHGQVVLPSDEEHVAASFDQYDDLELLHRVLKRMQSQVEFLLMRQYVPVGPQGGVVGGVWTFAFGDDDL